MVQESTIEFHRRWVETANVEAQSARHTANRDRVICIVFMILFFGAQLIRAFEPGMIWAKGMYLILSVPLMISLLKAGTSVSELREPERFLKECRRDLAMHEHSVV